MNNTQKIELLKHTIEELRNDIEKIKKVKFFVLFNQKSNKYSNENNNYLNQIENNDENDNIIKTTYQCENSGDEEQNFFMNKNNIKKNIKSKSYNNIFLNNKKLNEIELINNKKIPNNKKIKYQNEISKLKEEIKNLEEENEILETEIGEEEQKNYYLQTNKFIKDKNDEETILKIKNFLNLENKENIIPQLKEMINYIEKNYDSIEFPNKEAKLRDELIEKLEGLYITLTGNKNFENIEINIIWKWIKHLINVLEELNEERENNIKIYQQINENDEYKNFCSELLNEFNLNSIDNLKDYINSLLMENNINERRVEKIKKCLMNGNNKIEYKKND